MDNLTNDGKILGIIPAHKYTKITYWLMLFSAGLGLLISLLAVAGVYVPLAGLITVAGVIGLLMAILGAIVFQGHLTALDRNHMIYICVLFLAFFILGAIFGAVGGGLVILILSLLLSVAQLIMIFTGYNSFTHGREITQNNVSGEVQLALKRS